MLNPCFPVLCNWSYKDSILCSKMLLKCMKNKHFLQLFFVLSGIALVIYILHLYKDDLFMLPDIEDGNHKLPPSGASILFHE